MAYNTEAGPTKYLVGTEQGTVLSINLRNKKDGGIVVYDEGPGKHHGPIYSIERNPLHTSVLDFFWVIFILTEKIQNVVSYYFAKTNVDLDRMFNCIYIC